MGKKCGGGVMNVFREFSRFGIGTADEKDSTAASHLRLPFNNIS